MNGQTQRIRPLIYDIAIIGGGIHGCGIARDAAGRGLSVYLCEQGDFASATSSASTKLIHGGLRYLEHLDVRLVREALAEREVLMRIAPHLVRPRRFVLPHHSGLRPAWMLRLGLWLYDHIGGQSTLPPARSMDLASDPAGATLKSSYRRGFEYSDCSVDDARLVILNAMDAAERGASMNSRARCLSAQRRDGLWQLRVQNIVGQNVHEISARALVNAAGPWVNEVLKSVLGIEPAQVVRLDKGSHIVLRRQFEHDHAYIFQNADGRIVFAIPYQTHFTLIGTTDSDYRGDPATAAIEDSEIEYLLGAVNGYFRKPVSRAEIAWSYAGVRALCERPGKESRKLSREYELALDAKRGAAPLLSIYGGKITTYRRLAETALAQLTPFLQMSRAWTAEAPLPGGDMPLEHFIPECAARYGFLDRVILHRLVGAYGTRTAAILGAAKDWADLGKLFGCGLTEAELRYLITREWARTAEDVLWRRSKLGLHLNTSELRELKLWMQNIQTVSR